MIVPMTIEATQFVAELLKRVDLDADFAPADIGKRIGLSKMQSDMIARSLSDAGMLVIGFDNVAHFSPEYSKMARQAESAKAVKKPKAARTAPRRRRAALTPAAT